MLAAHDSFSPPSPRLRASRPSLIWTFSAHLDWFGRTVPVRGDDLVIGRSGADLDVDDRGVSRRHARISRGTDGAWTLVDLGSTNGTFLNGARVRAARLEDGDEIRVGAATSFRFSTSQDARGAVVLAA